MDTLIAEYDALKTLMKGEADAYYPPLEDALTVADTLKAEYERSLQRTERRKQFIDMLCDEPLMVFTPPSSPQKQIAGKRPRCMFESGDMEKRIRVHMKQHIERLHVVRKHIMEEHPKTMETMEATIVDAEVFLVSLDLDRGFYAEIPDK